MSHIRQHLIRAHVNAHAAFIALGTAAQRRAAARNERGSGVTEFVVLIVIVLGVAATVAVVFRGYISARLAEFKAP